MPGREETAAAVQEAVDELDLARMAGAQYPGFRAVDAAKVHLQVALVNHLMTAWDDYQKSAHEIRLAEEGRAKAAAERAQEALEMRKRQEERTLQAQADLEAEKARIEERRVVREAKDKSDRRFQNIILVLGLVFASIAAIGTPFQAYYAAHPRPATAHVSNQR